MAKGETRQARSEIVGRLIPHPLPPPPSSSSLFFLRAFLPRSFPQSSCPSLFSPTSPITTTRAIPAKGKVIIHRRDVAFISRAADACSLRHRRDVTTSRHRCPDNRVPSVYIFNPSRRTTAEFPYSGLLRFKTRRDNSTCDSRVRCFLINTYGTISTEQCCRRQTGGIILFRKTVDEILLS